LRTSTRWTIAVIAVIAALIVGLVIELRRAGPTSGPPTAASPVTGDDTDTQLIEPRRRADLRPCPAGPAGGGPVVLRGVIVECAADGVAVDAARVVAGRRVVLNLWAYWCVPCRAELPAMAEFQRRAGAAATVVTVHQDENQAAALAMLAQLGVRLPTLQDGSRRVAAALRVPNVMPATVVLAADGSVARILPQAFSDAEEIAAAVGGQG
jgi:thiol-disulfide isomerase/thioredoxin